MRAVVQRVKEASVEVNETRVSSISTGFLVYLGVQKTDELADVQYVCEKIVGLRVFEDSDGKMNLSIDEVGGSLLLVSQFTLYGDCRKGKRPSFSDAAPADAARARFDAFVAAARQGPVPVATGRFQAHMELDLVNDGPVTLLLDSRDAA